MTTTQDLKKKSVEELNSHIIDLRKEQFSLRMQQMSGQTTKPHESRRVRREIARAKFFLGQISKQRITK